jgi:hypothetical protein
MGVDIPPHEDSQWQPDEQNVLQDEFDKQPQWWGWQRGRGTERQNNKVHDDKNAKSIQERANNHIATQERTSVSAVNKNASHDRDHDEVKDQPKQGSGKSACKGGFTHYAGGCILQYANKWILKNQPKNDSLLDHKMEKTCDKPADQS